MDLYEKIGNIPTDKCDNCPLIAYCGDCYEEPHLCCDTSFSEMTVQQYIQAAQAIPYENIAAVAEKENLTITFDKEELSEEEQEEWEDECDKNIKKIIYEIIAEKESVPLENFYFTFSGADMRFPYQNGYLVVRAENEKEAFRKFRFRYPDPYLNCLCCASWYSQEKWDKITVDMGKCHEVIE